MQPGCNVTVSHYSINSCGNDVCRRNSGTSPTLFMVADYRGCFYGLVPGVYTVMVVTEWAVLLRYNSCRMDFLFR
ncbi:MAG: hypothetical protein IPP38_01975 [Bacteroidetes bacterium]|nr:hypothetical protein [Bacteroidota bacterium]